MAKLTPNQKLNRFIANIGNIVSGKTRRANYNERHIYDAFWSAVTLQLFTDIQRGYRFKSYGGTDDRGDRWEDLAVSTKAYKRLKDRKEILSSSQKRKLNSYTPGLMTPSQYARWRQTFKKVYMREMKPVKQKRGKAKSRAKNEMEAKKVAAQIAWNQAKKTGVETLKEVLGDAKMLIMRDTDLLYKSLTPGRISNRKYLKGHRNQVVDLNNGTLYIGTNVPYAGYASKRIYRAKGRGSFRREYLPEGRLGVWYDRAISAGRNAIYEELKTLIAEKRFDK